MKPELSSERGPEKPAFGSPCNGCGYCCAAEPCGIAQEYLDCGTEGPCPALMFGEGRFWCGMVLQPTRFLFLPPDPEADALLGSMIAQTLGAGRGCDADDFEPGSPINPTA